MKVILSPRAEKQLRKLPKLVQIIIAKKIRLIRSGNLFDKGEKLKGYRKIFRARVADYRIVYKKTIAKTYIILIAHRRDIYKFLKRLFR